MGTCSLRAHMRRRWRNGTLWWQSLAVLGPEPAWPAHCEPGGCGEGVTGERGTGPGFWWACSRWEWGCGEAGVRGLQRRGRRAPGARTEGPQCRERRPHREGPFGEGVAVGTPHAGRARVPAGERGHAAGLRVCGTCAGELRVPRPRLTPSSTTLELAAGRQACAAACGVGAGPRGGLDAASEQGPRGAWKWRPAGSGVHAAGVPRVPGSLALTHR